MSRRPVLVLLASALVAGSALAARAEPGPATVPLDRGYFLGGFSDSFGLGGDGHLAVTTLRGFPRPAGFTVAGDTGGSGTTP